MYWIKVFLRDTQPFEGFMKTPALNDRIANLQMWGIELNLVSVTTNKNWAPDLVAAIAEWTKKGIISIAQWETAVYGM